MSGGIDREDMHTLIPNVTHALTKQCSCATEDGTGRGSPLVAGPLTRRYGKGVNTTMDDGAIVDGVRRLTPLECERLQGLPDGWTLPGADSRRYAGLGDAVTASVAEWIGRRLLEHEERT